MLDQEYNKLSNLINRFINNMTEIWKVYKDNRRYRTNGTIFRGGYYEVSNLGRVKKDGKIVEPRISGGYRVCSTFKVSRAVAELFIPNPENKKTVDHIDTNKQNDNVNNLRWATQKENVNNPLTLQHLSDSLKDNPKLCHVGDKNPMYGKTHNVIARKKISEFAKTRTGNKNSMYGKNHTEEAKQKQREAKLNKKYVTNGIECILVHKDNIQSYLDNGYTLGRNKYILNK